MITIHPAPLGSGIISGMTTSDHDARDMQPLATELGVDVSCIHTVRQVHGTGIRMVTEQKAQTPEEGDALITDLQGVVLGVRVADCGGVLLWDPAHRAVAAVHSGWRGTNANILGAVIDRMTREYGTIPSELRGWVSPCASGERYEVREDVARLFPLDVQQNGPDTWLFDNKGALLRLFVAAGGQEGNLTIDPACTMADTRFHSHRREGERAGRCLVFIGSHKSP